MATTNDIEQLSQVARYLLRKSNDHKRSAKYYRDGPAKQERLEWAELFESWSRSVRRVYEELKDE